MPDYHLHLLGTPELRTATGEPVSFRTRKQFGLLVYLALEGRDRAVPRDRLIDMFWSDAPYERARHSLSQGLSAIRTHLGPDALSKGGRAVRLECAIETDLDSPGEVSGDGGVDSPAPLDGLDDAGGAEFGHWLDRVRHRLVTAVRRAVSSQIQDLRDAGDLQRVQERAAWLYRIDPKNETAVQLLAERSLAEGDVEGAARLLEEFLASNRGAPDCFLNAKGLLRRIRSGLYDVPSGDSSRSKGVRPDVFLGRHDETQALRSIWRSAEPGRNVTTIVEGPAGIGKSTLARRYGAEVAARGDLTLSVSCHHVTREIPYAALSGLAEMLSRAGNLGATDPKWLAEAARIAPGLRNKYPGVPEPPPVPADQTRLMIAQAFREMIAVVADGTSTLLVLEDIHNLDPASRGILHMIGTRYSASPLMILATLRTQHGRVVAHASNSARDMFDWDLSLQLGRLSDEHALALIKQLTATVVHDPEYDDVTRTILRTTQGHPYYIAVFIADWLSQGPESFSVQIVREGALGSHWEPSSATQAAFARHYQGLTANTRRLLQLIACAGRPLEVTDLCELTGISPSGVDESVIGSIAMGILTSESGCVSFTNDAHRAFFYHAATPPSRSLLHAKLARHLVRPGSPNSANTALEAAHHFLEAGMIDEATKNALEGAGSAIRQGAVIEAERLLRRILEREPTDWTDPTLLLAECLCLQGRHEESLFVLETTRNTHLDAPATAHRHRLEAECLVRKIPGDSKLALRSVTAAVEVAKRANNHEELNRCLLLTAELAAQAHDLGTIKSVQQTAASIAMNGGATECTGTADVTVGLCLLARGHYSAGYRRFDSAVSTFKYMRSSTDLATALNGRGSCAAAMGEFHAAIIDFQDAFDIAVSVGDNISASKLANNQAVQLVNLGVFDDARAKLDLSKRHGLLSTSSRYGVVNLCNEADYLLVVGDLAGAESTLREAHVLAQSMDSPTAEALALNGLADVEIARGEHDAGLDHIKGAERLLRQGAPEWAAAHGFDSEHMARITLFRQWREGSLNQADLPAINSPDTPVPLAVFVEIGGFVEWLAERGECQWRFPIPFRPLVEATGLFGTSERLRRLGMSPLGAP